MTPMSSFRIERQYVSFKSVETPNVHPVVHTRPGQAGGADPVFEDAENGPGLEHSRAAGIIERAREEAEKKSARIVKRAEKEAESTVAAAKDRAAAIIGEARESGEALRQSARAEGYNRGIKDAEAEAESRKRLEAGALEGMIDQLKRDYSELVDGTKQDLQALVIEIARKIIGVKLKESDEVFIGLINDAIDKLKQAGYLIIRVCPEDYARYFGGTAENGIHDGESKITVVEEEAFSPGDLIVESEGEVLNLSIERQIRQVEKAISE